MDDEWRLPVRPVCLARVGDCLMNDGRLLARTSFTRGKSAPR
jgi:hypothetical protein